MKNAFKILMLCFSMAVFTIACKPKADCSTFDPVSYEQVDFKSIDAVSVANVDVITQDVTIANADTKVVMQPLFNFTTNKLFPLSVPRSYRCISDNLNRNYNGAKYKHNPERIYQCAGRSQIPNRLWLDSQRGDVYRC